MKNYRCLLIFITVWLLGGCAGLSNPFTDKSLLAATQLQQELDAVNSHLVLMREITAGNYQDQVDLYKQTFDEHLEENTQRSRLRYALIMATSGHPRTDTGRGYLELREILEQSEELAPQGISGELTPLEINLAAITLHEIETIMILEARNAELSSVVSETRFRSDKSGRASQLIQTQAQKRLEDARAEIARLTLELNDANAKLDAIKNIEVTSE